MKYLFLKGETDPKIIGKQFHQTVGVPDGLNIQFYTGENGTSTLNNKVFPLDKTNFYWELKETAKLTDRLNVGNITAEGLFVNDKIKNILENQKLPEHRWYKGTIIENSYIAKKKGREQRKYTYWWLHLLDFPYATLDWQNSYFYKSYFGDDPVGDKLLFNNYDELIETRMKDREHSIKFGNLVFKDSVDNYDLFYLGRPVSNIICSEKLMTILQKEKVTGFKFVEFLS